MISIMQSSRFFKLSISTAIAAVVPQVALAAPVLSADTLVFSSTLANSGKDELAFFLKYAGDPLLNPEKPAGKPVAVNVDGQWHIDLGDATPGYFLLKFGDGSTGQHSHYLFKNDGAVGSNKLVWTNEQVNFLTGGGICDSTEKKQENKPGKGGKPDKNGDKPDPAPDHSSCGNIDRLSHFSFAGMMSIPPTTNPPTGNPPTGNPPASSPPTDNPPTDLPPAELPPTDVPEPGSLALAGLGLLALFGARKKHAK